MSATTVKERRIVRFRLAGLLLVATLVMIADADAQYFGRNKPGYSTFRFNVLQTPNFEIYHYLKDDSLLRTITQWSEEWYGIHQGFFRDTFKVKNPVIFYNTHADFQQTNTISSLIGTGTGGVTESLKNRVIMPVAPSLAQTDHTLGHELVHAFQYNMFLRRDTATKSSLANIPLWMIEGMAEYFSLGSVDPNTSMWMRDALINNDFPTIKQLSTDSRYFPYRYGQAFMSLAGKTWGDSLLVPLLMKTGELGFSKAADSILGYDEKTLSGMWKSATEIHYGKYISGRKDSLTGTKLISRDNAGRLNISPSISPDGKYIAFFSEKNVFSLDLYVADATTGRIVSRLAEAATRSVEDFNSNESTCSWSPDSRQFVFVVFSKGVNKLAFFDVKRGKITSEVAIRDVPSIFNPAWSPDGRKIAFTGMAGGAGDLYLYDIASGGVERLTFDTEANLHPSWSPDGRFLVYAQERKNSSEGLRRYTFNIALLDLTDRSVREPAIFSGAFNLNPLFSPDGEAIYFLSDADGFRNLYRYETGSGRLFRLTEYLTGISGITPWSPAISISHGTGRIAYNYYSGNSYQVVVADAGQFRADEVEADRLDFGPATLPPLRHAAANLVDTVLYSRADDFVLPADSVRCVSYKPRFKLDYLSNNTSVGTSGGIYRNNLGGSINMIFSDMVGDNQLYSSLALNGEIYDFGGQTAYINQKGKVKWGVAVSHIPYRAGSMSISRDSVRYQDGMIPVDVLMLDYIRMFEDNMMLYASLPFTQTRRLESTVSTSWYYYRVDRYNYYYLLNGASIGGTREKMPAPEGSNYQQISLAYVEDNSYSGMTSPMQGHRARFQADKYFGATDVFTALVDYRKYFWMKPVGLALRAYSYGMYGDGSETELLRPLYLGYPWLIRGYENVSYGQESSLGLNTLDISRLNGTRIAVANAELRFPFSGPEQLALIKSRYFLTDLNLFLDAGLAWYRGDEIILGRREAAVAPYQKYPLFSTGVSVRINVLGYLVLEPYYAFPMQNGGFRNGVFGLNFLPGW
jgi:Tol biopolymer transport system component